MIDAWLGNAHTPITEGSIGALGLPPARHSRTVAPIAAQGQRRDRPSGLALDRADEEETSIPRFITFFSYSAESAKAMIERPSDRSAAAKALVESLGGTQEAFYWMQGEHDGFVISNLPDGVAAAALAAAVGASGAVGGLETHQIFDHDEQAAIVKHADTARKAYKPPTA